jgi:hypothetical protein
MKFVRDMTKSYNDKANERPIAVFTWVLRLLPSELAYHNCGLRGTVRESDGSSSQMTSPSFDLE